MCLADLDVAIFCGGKGTRLGLDIPKCLALIRGRPFLEYIFDILRKHGAKRVVLLTGHLGEQIETYLAARFPGDMTITVSHDPAQVGTTHAITLALPVLTTPYILLVNGDTWTDADLCRFVLAAKIVQRPSILCARQYTAPQADSGFRLLSQAELQRLLGSRDNLEDALARRGAHHVFLNGHFLDIGTPERLAMAQDVLR